MSYHMSVTWPSPLGAGFLPQWLVAGDTNWHRAEGMGVSRQGMGTRNLPGEEGDRWNLLPSPWALHGWDGRAEPAHDEVRSVVCVCRAMVWSLNSFSLFLLPPSLPPSHPPFLPPPSLPCSCPSLFPRGRSPSEINLNRRELYKCSFLATPEMRMPEEPSEAQLQGVRGYHRIHVSIAANSVVQKRDHNQNTCWPEGGCKCHHHGQVVECVMFSLH